jgi:O-acetyl-ADP-ribose deacetylase (regulator of RNase III)
MMKIEIVEGDITGVSADALVNAANNYLWMGAGVAGAIKKAGGKDIEDEAVRKGPFRSERLPKPAPVVCR